MPLARIVDGWCVSASDFSRFTTKTENCSVRDNNNSFVVLLSTRLRFFSPSSTFWFTVDDKMCSLSLSSVRLRAAYIIYILNHTPVTETIFIFICVYYEREFVSIASHLRMQHANTYTWCLHITIFLCSQRVLCRSVNRRWSRIFFILDVKFCWPIIYGYGFGLVWIDSGP